MNAFLNSNALRKQGVYLDMRFLSLSSRHRNFLKKICSRNNGKTAVVQFHFRFKFCFSLFFSMVMSDNEFQKGKLFKQGR